MYIHKVDTNALSTAPQHVFVIYYSPYSEYMIHVPTVHNMGIQQEPWAHETNYTTFQQWGTRFYLKVTRFFNTINGN